MSIFGLQHPLDPVIVVEPMTFKGHFLEERS